MADQITEILQKALLQNAKSTVLKSLAWLVALLSSATIFASRFGMDKWLVVLLASLDCLAVIVYIAGFIFFALKDPEQLRSEKYSIQKLAIERGYIGDNITGYHRITDVSDVPLIPDSKSGEKGKVDK
jgi:predicted membrane channel-forming protein YqfA (hemolysin III family)